jgi:hypothetical protein
MELIAQIGLTVLLGAALWALSKVFGGAQKPTPGPRRAVRQMEGDGDFETDVVGESHYQDALAEIAGPKTEAGVDLEVKAQLVPEPDNPTDPQAVAVYIQGRKVGHLARDMAAQWVAIQARRGETGQVVEVDANITGGWRQALQGGGVSEGAFGVTLDVLDDLDD